MHLLHLKQFYNGLILNFASSKTSLISTWIAKSNFHFLLEKNLLISQECCPCIPKTRSLEPLYAEHFKIQNVCHWKISNFAIFQGQKSLKKNFWFLMTLEKLWFRSSHCNGFSLDASCRTDGPNLYECHLDVTSFPEMTYPQGGQGGCFLKYFVYSSWAALWPPPTQHKHKDQYWYHKYWELAYMSKFPINTALILFAIPVTSSYLITPCVPYSLQKFAVL